MDELQTTGGWCPGRDADLQPVSNSEEMAVAMTDRLQRDKGSLVATRHRVVQQPQRVTDVTVIVGGRIDRGRREPMRVVIVMDDDDVAVAIVAAGVAPVERAAADEQREQRGNRTRKETITNDAESHPLGNVAQRGERRNASTRGSSAPRDDRAARDEGPTERDDRPADTYEDPNATNEDPNERDDRPLVRDKDLDARDDALDVRRKDQQLPSTGRPRATTDRPFRAKDRRIGPIRVGFFVQNRTPVPSVINGMAHERRSR